MRQRLPWIEPKRVLSAIECAPYLTLSIAANCQEGSLPVHKGKSSKHARCVGVQRCRQLEQPFRLLIAFRGELVHVPRGAVVGAPGVETRWMCEKSASLLRVFDFRLDGCDDLVRKLILQIEYVIHVARSDPPTLHVAEIQVDAALNDIAHPTLAVL
jgi:hypothetical protein